MALRSWVGALAARSRVDTEMAQALVRAPVGAVFTAWTLAFADPASHPVYLAASHTLLAGVTGFFVLSAMHIAIVYRRPGNFAHRRLGAMALDNIAICHLLMVGGDEVLAVFAGLMWITVGYGMRYGPRYLGLAMVFALVTIAVVGTLNPWWRANPYVIFALIAALLVAPTYALLLDGQLRLAKLTAEAASLAKSRFLAQVSHDLRQPLHAVGLIAAGIPDANSAKVRTDIARRIDRSVRDARELLQVFLDRSIIDAGRLETRPSAFDLDMLLHELETANRDAAAWNDVRLRIMPTRAWIMADRAIVRTILQNLIANALRVSSGAGVLVGSRRRGDGLALAVVDSGPGIDPLLLSQIADPALDAGHLADGDHASMGLGLSIVWRLADHIRVSVHVRSLPGRGTGFVIGPFARAEPMDQAALASVPATPLSGLRVAVIGGKAAQRSATVALLAGWGCTVSGTAKVLNSGETADLIIGDCETPADAAALADWMPDTPLLLLSSRSTDTVHGWLGARAAIIATKPVTAAELRSLVMAATAAAR